MSLLCGSVKREKSGFGGIKSQLWAHFLFSQKWDDLTGRKGESFSTQSALNIGVKWSIKRKGRMVIEV